MNSGLVDLGFENMGVSETLHKVLTREFYNNGVIVPNTSYKMRGVDLIHAVFEPCEPNEDLPELPEDWVDNIYVFDIINDKFVYVGKNVRNDQLL